MAELKTWDVTQRRWRRRPVKMVKARFREEAVNDGDEIELADGVLAVTIHVDPERVLKTVVTWLEEVKE